MKLLLILISLMGIEVFAKDCDFDGEKLYSYSASIERDISYEISNDGKVKEIPGKVKISNCQPDVERTKVLLITLAPLEFGLDSATTSAEYNSELRDSGCYIENNPFKNVQKFEEKLDYNRKKFKFINSCVDIKISHSGPGPVAISGDTDKCKIVSSQDQEVVVRGVRCQINFNSGGSYEISYSINKECRNLDSLKKIGIDPSEYITRAMFWTLENKNSPDAKLELLGTSLTRFNIEPSPLQEKLSADLDNSGIPVYFANYPIPDVFFGEISLKNQKAFSVKMIAENRCQKYCFEGICTSPCDYTVPFVGQFSLYQLKNNGKKIFMNEWLEGSAIPSNFQGSISFVERRIPELVEANNGDKFFLEFSLSDPKFEYQLFKNKLKTLLPPMPGIPTTSFHSNLNSGFGGITSTGSIGNIATFGTIAEFDGSNSLGGLNGLEGLSRSTHWPADFELVCKEKKCQKISSQPFLKYIISFKVSVVGDQRTLEDIKIERKSNLLENNITTATVTPKVRCD